MNFKDYYSRQAVEYSKYRPGYPEKLFEFISSKVPSRNLAVDCATGNGQAAKGLAKHFKKVIALDASESQIANAHSCDNVIFRVAKAEDTGLEVESADLVTIATAIHWVDIDKFYDEVYRILKNNGFISIWTYSTQCEIDPATDKIINDFSDKVLLPHWDTGIRKVWDFNSIKFPFKQIKTPEFEIRKNCTREDFLNYVYTWSSVQKYFEVHNVNPVSLLRDFLQKVWDDSTIKEVKWKIEMKMGSK